jgi:predicted nucleic acid-binding protein
VALASANIISIADITRAEVISALARRAREGVITLNERDELIQTFRAHCATQYRIVPTQPGIIDRATELLQRHPLRAYDAVQFGFRQYRQSSVNCAWLASADFRNSR